MGTLMFITIQRLSRVQHRLISFAFNELHFRKEFTGFHSKIMNFQVIHFTCVTCDCNKGSEQQILNAENQFSNNIPQCLQPVAHSYSGVKWSKIELLNLSNVIVQELSLAFLGRES